MAFVRNETHSGNTAALDGAVPEFGRFFRWAVIFGAGAASVFLSLATLAGLVFLATSLTSPRDFAPHARKAATPDRLALAAALYARPARQDCRSGCRQRTPYIVQQAKTARTANVPDKHLDTAWLAADAIKQRFEQARASLTRTKLASAFAEVRPRLAALETSPALKDRFYPAAKLASLSHKNGPDATRFGPKIAEVERSSRLALALAGSGTLHVAYPVQTASLGPSMPFLLQTPDDSSTDTAEASASAFALVPESVPLPARRPKIRNAPAAMAEAAPRQPAKPTRQPIEQRELAYAAPNDGAPSIGQAFKNLFSSSRSSQAGNGVAVYDISAQTVTMPDGQVLEAHSGIGHMADDPRYANQKMNGPTPPNTYRLVMRESRFHGVEAIRMLPVDGKNKYGRDGILAHSYLLRGRPGQSHGCVAFADYDRFLKAFKQGKVKQIVVVPGRSSRSSTRIAKNGQGA